MGPTKSSLSERCVENHRVLSSSFLLDTGRRGQAEPRRGLAHQGQGRRPEPFLEPVALTQPQPARPEVERRGQGRGTLPWQVVRQVLSRQGHSYSRGWIDRCPLRRRGQRPKLEAVAREGVGLRERSEPVPFPQSVAGPHARRHARGGSLSVRFGVHITITSIHWSFRRGRSKKYPGKISRVHADGTFDVACCLTGVFLRRLRLPRHRYDA